MTTRNTTARDHHRAAIRRTKPPCGICGEEIDYTLKWPDPGCYVVDHKIPLDAALNDDDRQALDVIENKQAAHHKCNRDKWNKLPDATAPRTFVTTRTW